MSSKYLHVTISAEDKDQADKILHALLEKKLVTGGQIINAPARFLWKGEITNLDYFTITSFTVEDNKETIILAVEKVSIEDIPMITFTPLDGNKKLLNWIDETVG